MEMKTNMRWLVTILLISMIFLSACDLIEEQPTPTLIVPDTGPVEVDTPTPPIEEEVTPTPLPATPTEAAPTPTVVTPTLTPTPVDPIPDILSAAAEEWPLPNYDYNNTRANLFTAINRENINDLEEIWRFPFTGGEGSVSKVSSPLIANGMVYYQDGSGSVYAIDLETGELVWEYILDADLASAKGVALGYGKVFFPGENNLLYAVDMESGEELWSLGLEGPAGLHQPVVYDGMVLVGAGEDYLFDQTEEIPPAPGIVYAVDQETGEFLWQFLTIADGSWGAPEVNSGAGVYYPPAVDTDLGYIYWGTGSPLPFPGTAEFPNASSRPEPNLYANSIIALNSDSGQPAWVNYLNPADLFGHDARVSPVLFTAEIDGVQRNLLAGAGRMGFVAVMDREDGTALWQLPVGLHLNNDLQAILPGRAINVLPGFYGGVNAPMAYADGVLFIPVINLPTTYTADGIVDADTVDLAAGMGELAAFDVATGAVLWSRQFNSPVTGGATVVGDLVFVHTYLDGIYALQRENGAMIWQYTAAAGVSMLPAAAGDTLLLPVANNGETALVALRLGDPRPTPTLPIGTPTITATPSPSPLPDAFTATPSPLPDVITPTPDDLLPPPIAITPTPTEQQPTIIIPTQPNETPDVTETPTEQVDPPDNNDG
jgi:outer membrane protein assembly factor BamB